ncbi:MAG: FHA domain-containing protein [Betaproteobacteria bacterium]|nr:FHA domain-containing protein [Betaproteobacteria bacterium]
MSGEFMQWWWLEVRGTDGVAPSRIRLDGDAISIGRGYGNDVVLDDPYVSPAHAKLARDESGQWWIEDLGSDNGTRNAIDGSAVTRMPIEGRNAFVLGKTKVTLVSSASPVAATLKLEPAVAVSASPSVVPQTVPAKGREWPVGMQATVLLLAATALSALAIWLKQTGEPKVANYFYGAILLPLMVLGWAGVWALITRILAHQAHFARHVRIASIAMLCLIFTDSAFKVIDYAFAWVSASSVESLINWVVAAAMIAAHVRVIVPQRVALVGGIVGGLAVAALLLDYSMRNDRQKYQPPTIITSLLPPVFPTKPPVSGDKLFERIGALKAELDEERKKDPPAGFGFGGEQE